MTDHEALEALSKKATQGEWTGIGFGYEKYAAINSDGHEVFSTARKTNAAFIVALVNAYRTGQLIPAPSVETLARTLCLELGRMGDTEAVERNRVEADWPRYVRIATAAISAMQVKP